LERREWKLAVDRSHPMTANHPFLVPVVIDDMPGQDEQQGKPTMTVSRARSITPTVFALATSAAE
jgi:hypothetical protein